MGKLAEESLDSGDSTSAGSGSEAGDVELETEALRTEVLCENHPQGVGDAVYDGPWYVQNTFIHFAPNRPSSLVDFFKEREVHSCPASRLLDTEAPSSGIEAAVIEGYGEATPSHFSGNSEVYTNGFPNPWPIEMASMLPCAP